MTIDEMLAEVDTIPGEEGWWSSDCGRKYREAAMKLWPF